ncbi:SpoIIAA family protein [Hymenobacter convexus]|uniref:STAS/SEC14 domain-containing protein n=1 Tax=Hymenobacter sp. CA1UV-4 TaxID=3063782 RepID=UPI002713CA00|nr:STAS/SEC14 domain-containing protein [Hymenobacter sp. CA1UV-4]MDO7852803.1 STAS/SEC14 domain-containing protein [Hymenobacter sp. CA1UV-4]
MSPALRYFSNPAAVISYAPEGYVCLDWQPIAASANELRAIYEHVLHAMQHHRTTALMTVHNQRPPMPPEVQAWLAHDWMPRAVATVGYARCAVVEANSPLSRLAARAVGADMGTGLRFQYFDTPEAARAWLRTPATGGK